MGVDIYLKSIYEPFVADESVCDPPGEHHRSRQLWHRQKSHGSAKTELWEMVRADL